MSTRTTTHRPVSTAVRAALSTSVKITAVSYATLTLIPWAFEWALTSTSSPHAGPLLAALPLALLFGALAGYTHHASDEATDHHTRTLASAPTTSTASITTPALTSRTDSMVSAPTRAGPILELSHSRPVRPLDPADSPADHPVRHLHLITSTAQPPPAPPRRRETPDAAPGA